MEPLVHQSCRKETLPNQLSVTMFVMCPSHYIQDQAFAANPVKLKYAPQGIQTVTYSIEDTDNHSMEQLLTHVS